MFIVYFFFLRKIIKKLVEFQKGTRNPVHLKYKNGFS